MVTPAGRVKLLDFGVAQHRQRPPLGPDDTTRTGDVVAIAGFVGTLPYVAPEQATRREVDGRADIFSLGVMFYELVCGTPPFTGENAAQMLEAILRDDVPPFPHAVLSTSPADARLPLIERLVRMMLARDPERRVASAREVRAALMAIRSGERLPASFNRDGRDARESDDAGAGAGEETGEGEQPKRIAIASFTNISGNAEDDWLGTGIAETLIADVGQLEGVSVIARERVSELIKTLESRGAESRDSLNLAAARELRARWVVCGGFQRSGEAMRVTASLIDVASGQLVRTARVDGALSAIFDLQDQLVRELAQALRTAVTPQTHAGAETAVVEAYEALSRGILNRAAETHEALDRAGWLFERAVALDPAYARAHLELGATYATRADYLGLPELRVRAVASLRRAIELHPESPRAWRELGAVLVSMGQVSEGIAAIRRALALDYEDASNHGMMGRAMFTGMARFGDAIEWFEGALQRNAKAGCSWRTARRCCATSSAASARHDRRSRCRRRFSPARKASSSPAATCAPGTSRRCRAITRGRCRISNRRSSS
jgi:TolB-like protein